tara:strand:- start:273 stop:557 length:285 start_codon:yes stop_codon:yes gene_type:complete
MFSIVIVAIEVPSNSPDISPSKLICAVAYRFFLPGIIMIDVDFISNLPSSLHSAMSKYLFVKLEFASGSTSSLLYVSHFDLTTMRHIFKRSQRP